MYISNIHYLPLQVWWLENIIPTQAFANSVQRLPILFKLNLKDYSVALSRFIVAIMLTTRHEHYNQDLVCMLTISRM